MKERSNMNHKNRKRTQGSNRKPVDKNSQNQKKTCTSINTELPEDVLIGRNAVIEAIRSGRGINKLLIADGDKEGSVKEVISLAKEQGIVIQFVERSKIETVEEWERYEL